MSLSSETQNLLCFHPRYYLIAIFLLKIEQFNYQIIDGLNSKSQKMRIKLIFQLISNSYLTLILPQSTKLKHKASWTQKPLLASFAGFLYPWELVKRLLPTKEGNKDCTPGDQSQTNKTSGPKTVFCTEGLLSKRQCWEDGVYSFFYFHSARDLT